MIAAAWNPIRKYHLHFGKMDKLEKAIKQIEDKYICKKCIYDSKGIYEFLVESSEKEVKKNIRTLL